MRALAQACKVSPGLVSRALNGLDGVSEQTRALIMSKAQELGYDFDKLRPSLNRVAVLMLEDHDLGFALPFFSTILAGVDDICKQHQIGLSFSTFNQQDDLIKVIKQANGSAAIFIGFLPPKICRKIQDLPLPKAAIDSCIPEVICFNTNNYELSYALTQHVLEQGITRAAFMVPLRDHYSIQERERGFLQALYDHNLALDPNYVFSSSALGRKADEIDGYVAQLFKLKHPPEAIICYNDLIALEVLKACRNLQINIPQDVLLTGFDNVDFCALTHPAITSALVDGRRLGQEAMQALLNKTTPSNYIIKGHVIIRDSSCIPQGKKRAP